jgi:OFA family oxalate/formate antiporter-like MFS transporter
MAFTLAIFLIGVSAALGGRFVDRAGARKVATLAAILFGAGTLIAGYADYIGSKLLFWLGYGVIAGIGNGLGYITPIAILVRWFPDKRGMITGLAVMGFGFGGALMGQVAPLLILHYGVANTLYIMGMTFLVVILIAAQKMTNPPDDWKILISPKNEVYAHAKSNSVDFKTARTMYQFYLLWFVLFINVTAGIALISNLSPLAQAQLGLSAVSAGTLLFVASLFNGAGRIFWASLIRSNWKEDGIPSVTWNTNTYFYYSSPNNFSGHFWRALLLHIVVLWRRFCNYAIVRSRYVWP